MSAISSPDNQNRNECINFYCNPSFQTQNQKKRRNNKRLVSVRNCDEWQQTVPIGDALKEFIEFIERNRNTRHLRLAILIAHNAFCDSKVIVDALIRTKMFETFNEEVYGFIDTLQLFRKLYPNLNSYSQSNLVSYFLRGQYNAHNARDDCHLLQQLYSKALSPMFDFNSLSNASFDIKYAFLRYKQNERIQKNISSFEPLMKKKLIDKNVAKKLATNDLNVNQLKTVLLEKGIHKLEEKLCRVFGTKNVDQNYCRNIIRFLNLK